MSEDFIKAIKQKGTAFQILFYIIIAIYFIPLLFNIILSLFELAVVGFLFTSFWILIMIYLLKECKLYWALMLSVFISSLYFTVVMLSIVVFVSLYGLLIYPLIATVSLIFGAAYGFLFSKISGNNLGLIAPSIYVSSILALIFAFVKVISVISERIYGMLSTAAMPELVTQKSYFDVTIGFILFLIFFNIPFIKYSLVRQDINKKHLLLYLIPIILFIVVYVSLDAIFGSLVSVVVP